MAFTCIVIHCKFHFAICSDFKTNNNNKKFTTFSPILKVLAKEFINLLSYILPTTFASSANYFTHKKSNK